MIILRPAQVGSLLKMPLYMEQRACANFLVTDAEDFFELDWPGPR
jgi:hypothetical protein